MNNDEKYSIISVNADDDEVVVQAGSQLDTREGDAISDKDAVSDNKEKETSLEESMDRGEETDSESDNESIAAESESEYYETTQEELESVAPMSTMQKVIIGIAVLGVIVIVIYFNFVLR